MVEMKGRNSEEKDFLRGPKLIFHPFPFQR